MKNKNDGHRGRLKDKFFLNGFNGFLDYEIIELLLTIGIPRKDCKPLAKELISKYKNISNVINTKDEDLIKIKGLGARSIFGIKLVREVIKLVAKENINLKNKLLDIDSLGDFLIKDIGQSKQEIFRVACVNTKGKIILDTITIGTINASLVHPREIFRIAIDNNATYVVVAHNHPSGDTTPSEEDIYTTRRLVEAGKILGIDVLDHLIISNKDFNSLAKLGYI